MLFHDVMCRVLRAAADDGGDAAGGGSLAVGAEGGVSPVEGGIDAGAPPDEGGESERGGGAPPDAGGKPAAEAEGGSEGRQTAEEAAELAREFDLSAPPQDGEAGGKADDEGDEGGDAYALEFPDGFEAPEAFVALATPVARELGLDGRKAGAYAAGVVQAIQQAEQANFSKTAAELKAKWGRDYRANRAEAQKFYDWCRASGDFSDEDLRVFHSPRGVELLFKMSQRLGEKPAALRPDAAKQSELEWAEAASSDPNHPDYRALRDVDDPRFGKVRARFNAARGYRM